MESSHLLPFAFLLTTAMAYLCHRFGYSPVIGYLVTGVVIGPHATGLIKDTHLLQTLAEVGIVFLLFMVGLELSPSKLKKMKGQALRAGSLQILLTTLVLTPILMWSLHTPPLLAALLGFVIALSSTALVLKTLEDTQELETTHGRLILGTLIVQDMAVVPLLALIPLFGMLDGSQGIDWGVIGVSLLKAALLLSVTFYASVGLIPRIMDKLAPAASRELFTLAVFSLGLGMAGVTYLLGLGAEVGAFVGGFSLSGSIYSRQVLADSRPFRDVFSSLFFVSIGALFSFPYFLQHWGLVLALSLGIVIVKVLMGIFAFRLGRSSWQASFISAMALLQVGELSFMVLNHLQATLAQTPSIYQQWFSQWMEPILQAVILGMMATPLVMKGMPRIRHALRPLLDTLDHSDLLQQQKARTKNAKEKLATHPKNKEGHHALVVGFGPLAQQVSESFMWQRIPFHVIERNPTTVKNLRQEMIPACYGNAEEEDVLRTAGIYHTSLVVITVPDLKTSQQIIYSVKRMNPKCRIIARARFDFHIEPLYQAGADAVVYDELESAVRFINHCLVAMDCSLQKANSIGLLLRDQYEAMYHNKTLNQLMDHDVRLSIIGDLQMEWFHLPAGSELLGKELQDHPTWSEHHIQIIAILKHSGERIEPNPKYRLQADDIVLGVGTADQLNGMQAFLQKKPESLDC